MNSTNRLDRTVEEFVARPCTTDSYELGECCRWDQEREELYWIDIPTGRFFRAKANGAEIEIKSSYTFDGYLTAVVPMEHRNDGWLIALDRSIYMLDETGGLDEIASPEAHNTHAVRLNDGAADPWGYFWIGSMALDEKEGHGSLFRFHESTSSQKVLGNLTISNGLGWSPNRKTMYHADSGLGQIHTFDVDANGQVSNRRLFIQLDLNVDGTPDGMCVDRSGAIWVACWGGHQVLRFSATGVLLARVRLSVANPTCCAIGGDNGTTLYITTAKENDRENVQRGERGAGRLHFADVGVAGLPIEPYRARLP